MNLLTTRPLHSIAAALFDPVDCTTHPSALPCKLPGILHLLDIAAIILGLILLVVIGLAVNTYRKNKQEERRKP